MLKLNELAGSNRHSGQRSATMVVIPVFSSMRSPVRLTENRRRSLQCAGQNISCQLRWCPLQHVVYCVHNLHCRLAKRLQSLLRGHYNGFGKSRYQVPSANLHSHVNAPTISSTPSLQDILDERGREFLDEHWRRNDLIRFGDFEREWGFKYLNPNANALTNRLLPLSRDILNVNTNWKQNNGY